MSLNNDAIKALRSALREMSLNGISYDRVAKETKAEHRWTATALRQFARRDTQVRITPKVAALGSTVIDVAAKEKSKLSEPLLDHVRTLETFLSSGGMESTSFDLSDEIGRRLRGFRHDALGIKLPSTFAFVRFGRDDKKIIIIRIRTKRSPNGWSYSMKISGAGDQRRIVLGDVSRTAGNTYMTGIAYLVNEAMDDQEFSDLPAFDLDEVTNQTSQNEMGLEILSFSSPDLAFPVIPACFTGLDGAGRPISGIGAIISETSFKKLGIKELSYSIVNCAKENPNLTAIMKAGHCQTNVMSAEGAQDLQSKLFKLKSLSLH